MSGIRSIVRRLAPISLRRSVAVVKRRWKDWHARTVFADERIEADALEGLPCVVAIAQPIRRTAHFEGKVHNLRLAAARLNGLRVEPGVVASFWRVVGRPTERNGFQTGRTIISDRLSSDIGGGLCQVASLLYELGLRAGATIVERHPHSRDLYTEETRFTPLGLDAAIVWAFKDVRWLNPFDRNLALAFDVQGETIRGSLFGGGAPQTHEVAVTHIDDEERRLRRVEVRRTLGPETSVVSRDTYVIDPS